MEGFKDFAAFVSPPGRGGGLGGLGTGGSSGVAGVFLIGCDT